MTVAKTSRTTFAGMDFEPKERIILHTLKLVGPLTRQSLSVLTGLPINCICGRVRALLDVNMIELCGIETNAETGKPNERLRLVRRGRANG